jgi:hypothetical protein
MLQSCRLHLRLASWGLLLLCTSFTTGCASLLRDRVNRDFPPVSPIAGQLHAVRTAKANLANTSQAANVIALFSRDFLTGWLTHAMARPILPDDPKDDNAIQDGVSFDGAVVTPGTQDVAVAGRVSISLCPDRKWAPPPTGRCIDPIGIRGRFAIHFAPYVIPRAGDVPAQLAMHLTSSD